MGSDSTPKRASRKRTQRPAKPYPDFPLQPHATGHWCKRVRGKLHYFGKWAQREDGTLKVLPDGGAWQAALNRYRDQIDDLQAGRKPRPDRDTQGGFTIADLCNHFLTSKTRSFEANELSARSLSEYKEATDLLIKEFGRRRSISDLDPQDFEALRAEMAKKWGPSRLAKFVQMIRSVFKYGTDNGVSPQPTYGSGFKKPSKAVVRRHKAARKEKVFDAVTLRTMLTALDGKEVATTSKSGEASTTSVDANPQFKAIMLLGLNAALGNTDISNLQIHDVKDGWLHYPRPKTGIDRRVPLWAETATALRVHLMQRRIAKNKDDENCIFLNRGGRRMVRVNTRVTNHPDVAVTNQDYVSSQFRSLQRSLKLEANGLGFYSLRHTFATVALGTGDRDGVKAIMGHAGSDMLSVYDATGPSDARLKKVVDFVRNWLFGGL